METINLLLAAIAPVVVTTLTQAIKKIPVIDSISQPNKVIALNAVVALLSLGAGVGNFAITGTLDKNIVGVFVSSALTFISVFVTYRFGKKSQVQ